MIREESDTIKMTDEEMIDTLKGLVFGTFDRTTPKEREALDLAIKLLEKEKQLSDDYISRQDAIGIVARIKEMHIDDRERHQINYGTICDIDLALQQLPSVTPHPKMGRWVEENINEWSRKVFCSECGCLPPFEHISNGDVYSASGYGVINKTKFCPNCGAYMRESEK